ERRPVLGNIGRTKADVVNRWVGTASSGFRQSGSKLVNGRYQAMSQACVVCSPPLPCCGARTSRSSSEGSFERLCLLSHDGQSRTGESHAVHKSASRKFVGALRRLLLVASSEYC